ncbi:DUF2254 domain-containing protein [Telluribacter humicola]|uniref:DUF2254 domain-containing protein n=1 Tax=Telluribacter humicola TaxID=1720261 RepID=UPI001A96F5F6|nr:DUF2254 domain-containing protein [Telluribacter humicola]
MEKANKRDVTRSSLFNRFHLLWHKIVTGLWFIPSLMTLGSLLLAYALLKVDQQVHYSELPFDWFLYGGNREGARSVLSTIAASMVNIAGVTFSITLVALTMASSQFGPRLLRNFIADRGNQVVIGTFIATFCYALLVLLVIRGSDEDEFVPKISVVFGFLLSILSLGVLIYFIHHMASSIQAESVIVSSFKDLQAAVEDFMVDANEEIDPTTQHEALIRMQQSFTKKSLIESAKTGYIQTIDFKSLVQWAEQKSLVVHVLVHVGDFIAVYEPVSELYYQGVQSKDESELLNFFVIGTHRTSVQEIEFPIRQIVEVAVRALSPGINDPHTAITCLSYLGATLSILARKQFPAVVEYDSQQRLRIIKKSYNYQGIVSSCFDQIQVYALSNTNVSIEILVNIQKALRLIKDPSFKEALQRKARSVMNGIRRVEEDAEMVAKAQGLYQEIIAR